MTVIPNVSEFITIAAIQWMLEWLWKKHFVFRSIHLHLMHFFTCSNQCLKRLFHSEIGRVKPRDLNALMKKRWPRFLFWIVQKAKSLDVRVRYNRLLMISTQFDKICFKTSINFFFNILCVIFIVRLVLLFL